MDPFIKGNGSPSAAFSSRIRHIIRHLILNPRATAHSIKQALKEEGTTGFDDFHKRHLDKILSDYVTVRVDLAPLKYTSGTGTCFVYAKLNKKNDDGYKNFEEAIQTVSGVIEWDRISGRDRDYLIRVVGGVGHDLALHIAENIAELDNVADAFMSDDITIWSSGIIDNFEPDHFFNIEQDKSNNSK